MMPFIGNVIEIWKVLRKLTLVLSLLENILFFIPIPWLVNLSKIFNYKIASLKPLFSATKDSNSL
jgi:hypothetical protein